MIFDRHVKKFIYNLMLDLGILHGIGGHFGGKTIGYSMGEKVLTFGTPAGGAKAARNVTVNGITRDIDGGVFIPSIETLEEKYWKELEEIGAYFVSLGKTPELAANTALDIINRFQTMLRQEDLRLALETLNLFMYVLTGESDINSPLQAKWRAYAEARYSRYRQRVIDTNLKSRNEKIKTAAEKLNRETYELLDIFNVTGSEKEGG